MTSSSAPRVSVLMPVYNGEPYVKEAVASILNQTFTDYEFIVVDDGSTDETWSILESYAVDPRIRLIQNEINLGLARSLNRALAMARGEYVARMDADDVSRPNRLATQVAFLDNHRSIGVVGSTVQIVDAGGSLGRVLSRPPTDALIRWSLCFQTPLAHPSVLMRKAVLDRVGGYNDALLANQDRDLWHRLSALTRFANLKVPLLLYRKHPGQISDRCATIQARNSARAGQRVVSSILEYQVPFEVCYGIRIGRFENEEQALAGLRLIHELYEIFSAPQSISKSEDCWIRDDAAQRVVSIVWRWLYSSAIRRRFVSLVRQVGYWPMAKAAFHRATQKVRNAIGQRTNRFKVIASDGLRRCL